MRKFLLGLILLISLVSNGQKLNAGAQKMFRNEEETMKVYARNMIVDPNSSNRFIADSIFIRQLVQSLKNPYSFHYPYDSLETVSRLYAPDSTFRIFSWQFNRDDSYFRQRGAIQMKTADGSLKLFPLLDMSEFTDAPDDSVRTPLNWVGAIYYGIVMKTYNNKKYYTLLGFDDNNNKSTKKWLEVLTFSDAGNPVFGGPFFTIKTDKVSTSKPLARFSIEYKKDGRARMNYDQEMDMIVFDHLISENNTPDKKNTLVPDGDYEGFKWNNGHWVHVNKVFDFKLEDGQAPMPEPLKDDAGNSNEEKLRIQSDKNAQKKSAPKKPEPKKQGRDENEY